MKLLHTLKSGKTKELELTNLTFDTRHLVLNLEGEDVLEHEGWAVMGDYEEKEHKYGILFSPSEARMFRDKLDKMLVRFDSRKLEDVAVSESHDD